MDAKEILREEIHPVALRLCRWRRSVEMVTRVGVPAAGVVLVTFFAQGVGLLPAGSGYLAVAMVLIAVAATAFYTARQIRRPEDGLRFLGRDDELADAVRSALELGLLVETGGDAATGAMVKAHLLQTGERLKATPTTQIFGGPVLQRLQVMAVLCVCLVSVALL